MVRGISGNFHQGCQKYVPYNGMQCTAIALVAILLLFQGGNVDISSIGRFQIDETLNEGNRLYAEIVQSLNQIRYLAHSDLPDLVTLHDEQFSLGFIRDMFYGQVNGNNDRHFGQTSFYDSILQACILSPYQLLTLDGLTIALYVDSRSGQYFLFDSHERNLQGVYSLNGHAVFLSFDSCDELLNFFFENYGSSMYELTPVHILSSSVVRPENLHSRNNAARTNVNALPPEDLYDEMFDTCRDEIFIATPLNMTDLENCQNVTFSTIKNTRKREKRIHVDHTYSSGSKLSIPKLNKRHKHNRTRQLPLTNDVSLSVFDYFEQSDNNECFRSELSMIDVGLLCNVSTELDMDLSNSEIRKTSKSAYKMTLNSHENHTYCATDKVSKTRMKSLVQKKKATPVLTDINITTVILNSAEVLNKHADFFDAVNSMLTVGFLCEVNTEVDLDFIDYHICRSHIANYEKEIRQKPIYMCASCRRILYYNQVRVFKKPNNASELLNLYSPSDMCTTCYNAVSNNKIPSISYIMNKLDPGTVPQELIGLTSLEKRLISKINIFMSIVLLPGGQYAEKGLLLNVPAQSEEILSKLPLNEPNVSHVIIEFEKTSTTPKQIHKNPVSMGKIRKALYWLKENNPLYANVNIDSSSLDLQLDNSNDDIGINNIAEENVLIPVNPTNDCVVQSVMQNRHIQLSPNTNGAIDILEKESGEEMTFPWLFPYGCNGFRIQRPFKLNPCMYFRTRLYSEDSRFRKNITYLLHSAVAYNMSCLKSAVNIRMKVTRTNHNCSQQINAGSLRSMNEQDVKENSYMFMRKIKGTVAYFKSMLYDLLSMFRCLGPPTLFMTLSADDVHWPELGMTLDDIEFKEAFGHSFFTSMRSDPVLTATHFDRRFKALMNHVIMAESRPVGNVVDYFARVEFQNRGSPHIHMFLWIEGMSFMIKDMASSDVCNYIDSTVHSTIPNKNEDPELHYLVSKLQVHKHSSYCLRRGNQCRFGFPKKCCQNTYLLNNIDVRLKNKGRFYVTRRDHNSIFVNDYNPTILRHWRANMDIQIIQNAEGAAYYVCSYLCKSEPDDLKNALGALIHDVFDKNPDIPKNIRLMKIGFCVLKHRRMSAQEAAFRMGSLQLLHTTREFVYVNVWPIQKRMKMLKPVSELQNLNDSDTDIFLHNIVDYYRDRPSCLEQYSLFRFASWFVKINEPKNKHGKFHCPTYNVWYRKKKKFSIVRHTKFPVGSDDYYYSMILLLYPHRTEEALMHGFDSPQLSFENKTNQFDHGINHLFVSLTEEIENAVRRIQMCENEIHVNNVDENNSTDNTIDFPSFQLPCDIQHIENDGEAQTSPVLDEDIHNHIHSLQCSMSEKDFYRKIKNLSNCQKNALNIIMSSIKGPSITERFHFFLTGGAGTGKTHVLSLIIAYLELFCSTQCGSHSVVVCAPTGTAARNVRGLTIHSLLQIPVTKYQEYVPLHEYALSKLQRKFKFINSIVIDEISMVSNSMLTYISRRLSEIKNDLAPFGGMNIIVVGDFFQLRPIRGRFAFYNTHLWHLFRPLFLERNMRQSSDNVYADLLNRARVGYMRKQDISLLLTRLHHEADVDNILHVFPLREQVASFNRRHINTLVSTKYMLQADHYFSCTDLDPGSDVPNDMIPTDDRDAGGLHKDLELCIGARVMLIRNILTKEGLVNGAMGVVVSFNFNENNYMTAVNVVFDDKSIGQTLWLEGTNAVEIERVQHSYLMGGRTIIRSQFPLTLCWACTIHKVQGLSLDKVCVDIGSTVFEKGMAYVALSRVTKLSGLFLLRLCPSQILPPIGVLEEYDRLRRIT